MVNRLVMSPSELLLSLSRRNTTALVEVLVCGVVSDAYLLHPYFMVPGTVGSNEVGFGFFSGNRKSGSQEPSHQSMMFGFRAIWS